jgi:16S rRNA (cytosine967-C5)-methyltransferase
VPAKINTYPTADVERIMLDLWRTVCRGEVTASKSVAEAFAHAPGLNDRQRETIVNTVYGMLRHARRIDHALGQLPAKTPRALAELLAYRVLKCHLPPAKACSKLPAVDWDAVVARDTAVAEESDAVKRIAIGASLPDFLAKRLVEQFGSEAEALALSLNQKAPLTLRVNTLKGTRDEILKELTEAGLHVHPTALSSTGIVLESHANVFALDAFKDGCIEIQDEASQLVAELVAPPAKGLVVDYCAGAGGKTLAMGALMHNKGRLVALDTHAKRLEELKRRARRAGLANAQAIELRHAQTDSLRHKADRVLVDVPCSGVGAFRRKPEMRWRLEAEDLERLPREQDAIARRAMELVAPGGRLIYSTCTVLSEENEAVVEKLLSNHDFTLVPAKEIVGKALAGKICDSTGTFLKLLPHRHSCDGFFAAVLRRSKPAQ